jgi:hypothetical protein
VIDATGLGDPISDDLIRAGVPVDPVKLTNESKKDIIEKLSIWIELRKLSFINIADTLTELDNFSYEISSNGRIVYNAREGTHDDVVIAHALAVWKLTDMYIPPTVSDEPLLRQEYRSRIKEMRGQVPEAYDEQEYEAI